MGGAVVVSHTLQRADQFNHREKITVISQAHKEFASHQMALHAGSALLMQPRNCDTRPGVSLALSYLKFLDPDAIVIILPSDHFIFPAQRFRRLVNSSVSALTNHSDQFILLGVLPSTPETECGWVQPGSRVDRLHGLPEQHLDRICIG
ncbi:sugar phosphate nucleotidyltransferase [Nitrospira sp. MA-1]|nr:sugar phosphate nucleotidyltransferase [Nitrospira sp. MA-1]